MAGLVPVTSPALRLRCVLCLLPVALVGATACAPADPGHDAGPPPIPAGLAIERFEASRSTAPKGALVTLSWRTRSAAACTLAPEVGIVPRSGELSVTLADTTTYTLSCEGSGEAVSAELTLEVVGGGDGGPSDGGEEPGPAFELSGDVEPGEVESSFDELTDTSVAWLVPEQAGAVLEENLDCDIHLPAVYDASSSTDEPRCIIPAGTSVDSYLLHGMPLSDGGRNALAGTVVFAREIVALQWRAQTLGEGDRVLGRPGVSYGDPSLRYYGIGSTDEVTLEADRRTLHFSILADDIDELRIITLAGDEESPLLRSTTLAPRSQIESLVAGARRSDSEALLLFEQSVTLDAPLEVDIAAPGTYEGQTAPTPESLPAGTTLSSAIVHFDPRATSGPVRLVLTLTLPKPVLGLIVDDDRLSSSDSVLGLSGTAYPTGTVARGLELQGADAVWFAEDRRSLRLSVSVGSSGIDQLRVLYEP